MSLDRVTLLHCFQGSSKLRSPLNNILVCGNHEEKDRLVTPWVKEQRLSALMCPMRKGPESIPLLGGLALRAQGPLGAGAAESSPCPPVTLGTGSIYTHMSIHIHVLGPWHPEAAFCRAGALPCLSPGLRSLRWGLAGPALPRSQLGWWPGPGPAAPSPSALWVNFSSRCAFCERGK